MRTIQYARKRKGLTDYRKRLKLLKSGLPRLIVRLTNKYVVVQIAEYAENGDKVLSTVTSSKLKALGWKHSCKNLPACYLTGLLLAKNAKIKSDIIVDTGLRTPQPQGRIAAVIKGAIDGGLKVRAAENILPSEERLFGGHINETVKKDVESLKSKV